MICAVPFRAGALTVDVEFEVSCEGFVRPRASLKLRQKKDPADTFGKANL